MTTASSRTILNQQLGELLVSDADAASDVLDHLLSIESSEDLLEYLSQLLGLRSTDDKVQNFVQNIIQFRRGEDIVFETPFVDTSKDSKTSSSDVAASNVTKNASASKSNNSTHFAKKESKKDKPRTNKKTPLSSKQTIEKTANLPRLKTEDAKAGPPKGDVDTLEKNTDPQEPSIPPIEPRQPPPRGQAPLECGCFGTLHPPLANCLFCGRISCSEEGYNFCPFCGYLVEQVQPPDGEKSRHDPAWLHKERLLQFDREFASRTVVFDDTANYESQQTATWLSPEQQEDAQQKEKKRQDQLHQREAMQLNVVLP